MNALYSCAWPSDRRWRTPQTEHRLLHPAAEKFIVS
jgi:hypothetical protein